MAKHMTITIETDSFLILRSRSTTRAWCSLCGSEVEMVTLRDTGNVFIDPQALDRWLKNGALHRADTVDGSVLICLNSLLARMQNTTTYPPLSGAAKKETK